jgi:effector-binding domain-containing protein
MIETPRVIQTKAQLLAVIPIVATQPQMRTVMGPGMNELVATLAQLGVTPSGSWLCHHLRMPTDTFEFEIAIPVTETVPPTGRVQMSQLPETKAARTVYHGPYEGMAGAWNEFMAWVKANDLKYSGEFWEQYLLGPEAGDPANYRTELTLALLD